MDADSFVEYGAWRWLFSAAAYEDLIQEHPDAGGHRPGRAAQRWAMAYDATVLAGTQGMQPPKDRPHAGPGRAKQASVVLFAEGGGGCRRWICPSSVGRTEPIFASCRGLNGLGCRWSALLPGAALPATRRCWAATT